ncbi:MAG: glycoside hydrolase [Niastella sp.]|nr:glycoside hydrolase [Niastella sp.]
MKGKSCLILILALISVTTFARQTSPGGTFTAVELQPATAYLNYNGKECRMARLSFKGGKCFTETVVTVSFNGLTEQVMIPAAQEGLESFELPLPGAPVTKDVQATVAVQAGRQTLHARCIVPPSRKWTVYVLPHSHVDVGYTNVQPKVLKLHMDNIDESIALAAKTQSYPAEARFKWNTEAMWVVDNYLRQADETKKKNFWDAVRKGWIGVDGAYGNINTSVTDSRQLMQMFYDATKEAKLQGVTIKTLFQGDVPGSSWGLATQAEQTGIKYFLSGPNASDRIGHLAQWQDKPFYLIAPSGKNKMLFWQCQPYSIGYALKGSKIPNFFTVEDPKPFYTGKPSENFLNPYLFGYLSGLEQKAFPYDMTILTWAMSDNAPIDPELPDAVKAWNEKYASPKLVITTTRQFFDAFEQKYQSSIPELSGDYTEYWTDGLGSAARETGINRVTSDKLQQADAIWAIKNKAAYPGNDFRTAWKNLLLFSEHTWGAHNSVGEPDDPKVKEQWRIKQSFALDAQKQTEELMRKALDMSKNSGNNIDVFNTLSWPRTDLVTVTAAMSKTGDIVVNEKGEKVPAQRLSTGELVFVAENVPALGKSRFTIQKGKAAAISAPSSAAAIENDLYKINIDKATGTIERIEKKGSNRKLVDGAGFNKYIYLPGDSVSKMVTARNAKITIKEIGPVLMSLLITADAPGAKKLETEIRLINGIDRIEVINMVDKQAIRSKEAVHFAFPFTVDKPQVRYNIPWGSIEAEADQLAHSNRNWYTMQRWVDISNADYGVTLSSLDAPLFQIGNITTGGLLGGLRLSPLWMRYTNQSSHLYSWVMNNLWHTNFRADQEGPVTFRYYITVHEQFNTHQANRTGMENHRPLVAAPAQGNASNASLFEVEGDNVYVEGVKPCYDGKGTLVHLVNSGDKESTVTIKRKQPVTITQSNLLEEDIATLQNVFVLPAKGIITIKLQ